MTAVAAQPILSPAEVERLSERDGKLYELVRGELKEKQVGAISQYVASRIAEKLNVRFAPAEGYALTEGTIYCFGDPRHGRRPDALFILKSKLPDGQLPQGDLLLAPDVVVEVLSPSNGSIEMEDKLEEYAAAGIPLILVANPHRKTIRVYRSDLTYQLFRENDVLTDASLPGFEMRVGDVFP